jgi:hypothetical protein
MTGVDPEVIAFYERGDEAGRLESLGRLEFARMMELLERFLPPVPAVVFDVGGGAGAYALALAHRGYEVHLLDPIALHVEQALAAVEADPAAELASALIGDARQTRGPHARDPARGSGAEPARRQPPRDGDRYSTVTVLARLRGWSTFSPRRRAIR